MIKILLVAGGTAGHINPALAMAEYFKEKLKNVHIEFAGTPNGMESKLIPKAGYKFNPIEIHGFKRKVSVKNFFINANSLFLFLKSNFKSRDLLKNLKPDIVIGTGGYVCGSLLLQAKRMGFKTAIHEQNAYPGITNKYLAKKVDLVLLEKKKKKKKLPRCNYVVVGNPLRKNVLTKTKEEARKELNMDDEFCILSFGGSLGALKINEIAADLIQWHNKFKKINHIHAMGKLGSKFFPQMLAKRNVIVSKNPKLYIRNYIYNMETCLAACDLVICRSGALTIAELQATKKASILIPSPNVAENHQYYNALVLSKKKAAVLIEEKNYDKKFLIKTVKSFYEDREKLKLYSENAYNLAIHNTKELILNEIKKLLKIWKIHLKK